MQEELFIRLRDLTRISVVNKLWMKRIFSLKWWGVLPIPVETAIPGLSALGKCISRRSIRHSFDRFLKLRE